MNTERSFLALCLGLWIVTSSSAADPQFDLIIRNGRVVDGTGSPWYRADIAVSDGKIISIGSIANATSHRTIDARGLIVAPGFIDMMGQSATPMLRDKTSARNLLTQGITTVNCGEGASAAPLHEKEALREGWSTFGEYFTLLEQRGLPVNVVQTIGHTQVRRIVLGEADRRPTDNELSRMQQYVRTAMEDGAIGVSTALIYPPAVYASKEEIAALAKIAGEYGGRYFTHMRNEGDRLLEALDEALEIGAAAGTPVHIFHLKAAGEANWNKVPQAIAKIREARSQGREIAADIYPYINNGLGIEALLHPRHFTEGRQRLLRGLTDPDLQAQIQKEMQSEEGWENWYRHVGKDWDKIVLGRIDAAAYADFAGQSLGSIARQTRRDPWKVFFEIVRGGAFALPQSMSEDNKELLINQEFISFCTDVGAASKSRSASHPRAYGSFPRLLGRYIRDRKSAQMERVISQATALAANEILAFDRGRIAIGQAADLVVFDSKSVIDNATFEAPDRVSKGIRFVIVNGHIALDNGKLSDLDGGRVLRGPGFRTSSSDISTGDHDPRMSSFDELMTSFITRHGVPGAALAVTRNSEIVYSRGYGYADLAKGEATTAQHLYRIASLSKPITAVAVLRLIEDGKLTLDSKVFDILELHPQDTSPKEFDERWKVITIEHLLRHTGGWDRDVSYDAMFQSVRIAKELDIPAPAGAAHVIQFMLNEPLDFTPGSRYAYSNFGYCLLGRVIEKVTGRGYEEFVRQSILKPLGMHSTRLGRTRLAHRLTGEVRYYDPNRGPSVFEADLGAEVPSAYGAWNLEAMDSHGGWLSTAEDLARFACAFDDPNKCPILDADSVRTMFSRPSNSVYPRPQTNKGEYFYGLGWLVRPKGDGDKANTWHTGSLPGTATLLVRRHDGLNWVILFNARQDRGVRHLTRSIDPLVHEAADHVVEWPNGDDASN